MPRFRKPGSRAALRAAIATVLAAVVAVALGAMHGGAATPATQSVNVPNKAGQITFQEWARQSGKPVDAENWPAFIAERRRYEERIRELFREGVEGSELRTDLDVPTAALLFLSAANWAYTWLRPGSDTDQLADRLYAALLDGMRGYATP